LTDAEHSDAESGGCGGEHGADDEGEVVAAEERREVAVAGREQMVGP